jgi:hypothetical protein
MEPLVQWLLGGLILSLLFIGITRWFWSRYDKPSEEAIEWQKEQAEKRKERKVWESVEMQMRREAEEAEQKATFQQKRIKAASSGTAPDAKVVAKAFESLGGTPSAKSVDESEVIDLEDDSDVHAVDELVEVRQDALDGETPPVAEPEEPDWELVERLKRIAEADELEEKPHPELPDAPILPDIVEEE